MTYYENFILSCDDDTDVYAMAANDIRNVLNRHTDKFAIYAGNDQEVEEHWDAWEGGPNNFWSSDYPGDNETFW